MGTGSACGPGELRLRDGVLVDVQPLRPEDSTVIAEGFAHLSPQSRYKRFFVPATRLSTRQLAYLATVDHLHHEALGASHPATGEGIAVARYVRLEDDPSAAEVALTVVDAWQRRGVGSALLERLAECARERGIERFTAMVLAENASMLHLLAQLGHEVCRRREAGAVELVVAL